MMGKLHNKNIIVTGGTQGIGLKMTEVCLKEGANVVTFSRRKAAPKISSPDSMRHKHISGDVKNQSDLIKLYQNIQHEFSKIDVIIANAGIGLSAPYDEIMEEDFDDIVGTNLKGAFFSVQYGLPQVKEYGSIIFIGSLAAHLPEKNNLLYAASKSALVTVSKSLAAELVEKNIRVNIISPSYTKTEAWEIFSKQNPEYFQNILKELPNKKLISSDRITDAMLYFASDGSIGVTGTELIIDDGYRFLKNSI